jgi:hypothetical protein
MWHHNRSLAIGLSLFILAGCAAQTPVVRQNAQPRNLGIVTPCEHARIEVMDIIQPGDSTSWLSDAHWTEIVLRVVNTSTFQLTAREAQVIDARGGLLRPLPQQALVAEIQQQVSKSAMQAQSATATGQVATGALQTGAAFIPIPGLSAVLSAAGMAASHQQSLGAMSAANQPQEIMAELQRRALAENVPIPPGRFIQGSVFFPRAPAPQALLINYEVAEAIRSVEVPLQQGPVR